MAAAATTIVHMRLPKALKNEAMAIFEEMGLTFTDAVRLLLVKTAKEKTMPFDIWTPNKATTKAMQDTDSRKGKRMKSVDDLFAEAKK